MRWCLALLFLGCGGAPREEKAVVVPAQPPPRPLAFGKNTSAPFVAAPSTSPAITSLATSGADCGLDADGRVWSWATGAIEQEVPSLHGARAISCAASHSCVVLGDGTAWCWGGGSYGALGNGFERASEVPVRVVGLTAVVDIATDFDRTCARTANGDVYCWGDSEFGKAGDGRMPDNVGREKVLPGKPILTGASSLGIGLAHACSAMSDGRLSCWGQNNAGSCGQPLRTRYVPHPALVPKVKDIASFSASESVSCSLDCHGAVACWGSMGNGFLGLPGEGAHETPVPIQLPDPAVEVVVGAGFGCARLTTSAVYCWGNNDDGAVGDGSSENRLRPVKTLEHAQRISASYDRACALVEGGRVFCWGKDVARPDASSRLETSRVPVEMRP